LEDNQCRDCNLDPKKSKRELFQRTFARGIFWSGVSRYAATPLIVALSSGHRFHPWSPIATENHLDRVEKFHKLRRRLASLMFFIRVQAFRDPLRGELPHAQNFMNDGPNPLT